MELSPYLDKLAAFVDSFYGLNDDPPSSVSLLEELHLLFDSATQLETDAPEALGQFGEVAVQLIEELGVFRFRLAAGMTDAENAQEQWPEFDDDRWHKGHHWLIKLVAQHHLWNLMRLFQRAVAYERVFGTGGKMRELTGSRKIKPDAETLAIIKMIDQGTTEVDALCKRAKKGAAAIRQIISRRRRGLYEM